MKRLTALIFGLLLTTVLEGQGGTLARGGSGNAARDTFRFVVYGDTRTHHDIHEKIIASAVALKPSFILQTGDLVADGSDPQQWERFRKITKPIRDNQIPYYPVRGNHDTGGRGFENETPPTIGRNTLYYTFDFGRLRFIGIDTEEALSQGSVQYSWLKDELEKAQRDKLVPIPFFHKAIYSVGRHGCDFELQRILEPLFREAKVRLVFQGHDHLYYRTNRNGITYVVTGGGGAPLYDVKPELLQAGDVAKSVHHLCVVDVQGSRIHIVARGLKGEVVDDFEIPMPATE